MTVDGHEPFSALERALRRMLTDGYRGSLCDGLGGAIVDAANEELDNRGRVITLGELNYMFDLSLGVGSRAENDDFDIPLDDPETGAHVIAALLVTKEDLQEVIEATADDYSRMYEEEDDDGDVEVYEVTVDNVVCYVDYPQRVESGPPTWRFGHTVEGAVPRAPGLAGAFSRMLRGADAGSLVDDLSRVLVDAANEELDSGVTERVITVADLNDLLGLSLGADWDPEAGSYEVPLYDRQAAVGEIAELLVGEWDLLGVLLVVASQWSAIGSSPEGTATMMSDGGIGLYELTVDDRVYFFTHAAPDVEDPQLWFAHAVGDEAARTQAIESALASIGSSEDADAEH